MKRATKIFVYIFATLFVVLIVGGCFFARTFAPPGKVGTYGETFYTAEDKENYIKCEEYDRSLRSYHTVPSLEDDFAAGSLIAILDAEHSGICVPGSFYDRNYVIKVLDGIENIDAYKTEFYFENEPYEVYDYTHRVMVRIELEIPGKDNVLRALEDLQNCGIFACVEADHDYVAVSD